MIGDWDGDRDRENIDKLVAERKFGEFEVHIGIALVEGNGTVGGDIGSREELIRCSDEEFC